VFTFWSPALWHHSPIYSYRNCDQYLLVAEFWSDEQKSCFHNTHRRCHWHSIKIFQLYLSHHIFISFQCNFKNITLFSLCKEEEHRLCLVRCGAYKNHPSLRIIQVILQEIYYCCNSFVFSLLFYFAYYKNFKGNPTSFLTLWRQNFTFKF